MVKSYDDGLPIYQDLSMYHDSSNYQDLPINIRSLPNHFLSIISTGG